MNTHFQYPSFFWLLVLVPVFIGLFVLYLKWWQGAEKRIGEPRLVRPLFNHYHPLLGIIRFFLLVLSLVAGILAVANLRKPQPPMGELRKGIDVVIALDLSNSMLAPDAPPSRLSLAKRFISSLTEQLPDSRFGLVVFAGQAYVQMPLTYDASAARMFVAAAHPSSLRAQGTALNEALSRAESSFTGAGERYRSIVVVTDGETHDFDVVERATALAERGIVVHTVGIGSAGGAAIIDSTTKSPRRDAAGNIVISKLNEPLLKEMAAVTKGSYIHLDSVSTAVREMAEELNRAEKKGLVDATMLDYETRYSLFALPMLLLLLAELFFPTRKPWK